MRLLLDAICREQLSVGSSRPRWLTAHMGRRLRAPAGCWWICLQPRLRADCSVARPPTQSRPDAEHTHTHTRTHTRDMEIVGFYRRRCHCFAPSDALSWRRRSATPAGFHTAEPCWYGLGYRLCRSAASHGGGVPRFSRTSSARVFTATDDRTRSSLLATHHRQSRELGAWEGTAGTPVDIFVW